MLTVGNTGTPVVLLKSTRHGALGIARSLGRLGVPVFVVDRDAHSPVISSRYCRQHFSWDLDGACPQKSVEFLLEVGRKIGCRPILIPTTDEAATFAADHAGPLSERYLFPDQKPQLVHALSSKKEMYHLAKKFGVPTAETLFPESRADVLRFAPDVRFPVMLKGIYGKKLKQRAGKPMFIARNQKELLELYDRAEDPAEPNLMLQEYIPGGDDTIWMFNGYFNRDSDCLFGSTGKKIRQCPVHTGATSLGICLSNETVESTTRRFMKALGYRGILDLGYRYDARDGRYKVLDINPRIGATFRLFAACNGMDVARALYLDLTGQPGISGAPCEGRKWIVEDNDLVSCFRYYASGKLSLGSWLKSYWGIQECAIFAADDPAPVLRVVGTDLGELAGRLLKYCKKPVIHDSKAWA